jgi:hypothetical protein
MHVIMILERGWQLKLVITRLVFVYTDVELYKTQNKKGYIFIYATGTSFPLYKNNAKHKCSLEYLDKIKLHKTSMVSNSWAM